MTGPTIGARHYGETHKWTPTEDIIILDMAKRMFSAREIAKKISEGTPDRITRLSVIGRLSRLGHRDHRTKSDQCLSGIKAIEKSPKPEKLKIKIFKSEPLPEILEDASLATISASQARDFHCAWIVGDPKNQQRCSNYAVRGCSWCDYHACIVFASVKPVPVVSRGVSNA